MAWTTISNLLVAVGAKPFATTFQALRDNPVAIANGDADAPKVIGPALLTHRGIVTSQGNGGTPVGWTDLDRVEWMRFDYTLAGAATSGTVSIQWRFSVNAGSSWSSYVSGPDAAFGSYNVGTLWLNLVTGQWRAFGTRGGTLEQSNGTTAPPGGGVNGLQFRTNSGGGTASATVHVLYIAGHIMSGVTP